MRVLYLTNSEVARPLAEWLEADPANVVVRRSGPLTAWTVEALGPDLVISYNYRHIVKPEALDLLRGRVVNLHISYLPWNRGAHPNVWSFLDETPKGVTIHLMDAGVDTGPILCQRSVELDPETETFESSYERLHREIQALFVESWDRLRNPPLVAADQDRRAGSRHLKRDLDGLMALFGDRLWTAPIPEVIRKYRELRR